MIMVFSTADIQGLVESIWGTMLGFGVVPSTEEGCPGRSEEFLTGSIQVTGAWDGAITQECPLALLAHAAEVFFGPSPEGHSHEELRDTLGELTNITGGNLKSLLPGTCFLGMPTVVEGTDYTHQVLHSRVLSRTAYQCLGHPFKVTVLEREAPVRRR
jgi:chemotaxis protein CheX